jgi:hypothetical protein
MENADSQWVAAVTRIRNHLEAAYTPLFAEYQDALVGGDDERMAELGEGLAAAADEAETLWTATLHTNAMDLSPGVFVNEAAGAMAMLSDLWSDLTEAHRRKVARAEP